MNTNLKLVTLDSVYCDFLRKFDSRVIYNFDKKNNRPYAGVLFEINGCKYFAPLASPKPKHQTMKKNPTFLKIDSGKLGVIYFNNMIPVMEKNLKYIDLSLNFDTIDERNYQKLLKQQLYWLIRTNTVSLYDMAENLYRKYNNGRLPKFLKDLCCDFPILEVKCKEYNSNDKLHNN